MYCSCTGTTLSVAVQYSNSASNSNCNKGKEIITTEPKAEQFVHLKSRIKLKGRESKVNAALSYSDRQDHDSNNNPPPPVCHCLAHPLIKRCVSVSKCCTDFHYTKEGQQTNKQPRFSPLPSRETVSTFHATFVHLKSVRADSSE